MVTVAPRWRRCREMMCRWRFAADPPRSRCINRCRRLQQQRWRWRRRGGSGGATTPDSSPPTTARAATSAAGTTTTEAPTTTTEAPTTTAVELAADPFTLGVTSGDPDATSVVLWTRLTGDDLPDEVDVTWEVAEEPGFADVATTGTVTTSTADGHSVHVIADVSAPSWYRFRVRRVDEPRRADDARTEWSGAGGAHRQRRRASTSRRATTPPTATSSSGSPISSRSSATSSTRERRASRLPTGCASTTVRRSPTSPPTAPAMRSTSRIQICGRRGRSPRGSSCGTTTRWRTTTPGSCRRTPPERCDVLRPPRHRLPGVVGEHMPVRLPRPEPGGYAIHRALRWGELADFVLLDGRQHRSDQACNSPTLSTDPATTSVSPSQRPTEWPSHVGFNASPLGCGRPSM